MNKYDHILSLSNDHYVTVDHVRSFKREYECEFEEIPIQWKFTLIPNGRYSCFDCYQKHQPDWERKWEEAIKNSASTKSTCYFCGSILYHVRWAELPRKVATADVDLVGALGI